MTTFSLLNGTVWMIETAHFNATNWMACVVIIDAWHGRSWMTMKASVKVIRATAGTASTV